MKTILSRIALAFLIASLATLSVFAKGKKETANFPTNIKVNGTLVKKGVYDLKFDDKTGELLIMKGDKVIARAATSTATTSSASALAKSCLKSWSATARRSAPRASKKFCASAAPTGRARRCS